MTELVMCDGAYSHELIICDRAYSYELIIYERANSYELIMCERAASHELIMCDKGSAYEYVIRDISHECFLPRNESDHISKSGEPHKRQQTKDSSAVGPWGHLTVMLVSSVTSNTRITMLVSSHVQIRRTTQKSTNPRLTNSRLSAHSVNLTVLPTSALMSAQSSMVVMMPPTSVTLL